jgi:hypothetical protein
MTRITQYDRELVRDARRFLAAAAEHPESRGILERFGFNAEEQERGARLVDNAERSFDWEASGKAWNFLSVTPERRIAEARAWYADTRRRYARACLKRAEHASGWVGNGSASRWPVSRKLALGTAAALWHASRTLSAGAWLKHRFELARNVRRARGERPEGAPPPKDSALVELAGWYERWRLLAQRVFRARPDLMAPYGLTPGKAPPRLRSRSARLKYGEQAAGSLGDAPAPTDDAADQGLEEPAPDASLNPRSLPIV